MAHTSVRDQERMFGLIWAVVALALWTAAAARAQTIKGLKTTWVGELAAGETGRLAVSWSGMPGAELSTWVDFDGDGGFDLAELVVDRALLGERIELYEFTVPLGAVVDERTRMRLRMQGDGGKLLREVVRRIGGEKRGAECEWASGFHSRGLDRSTLASVLFDDGSGLALYVGGYFIAADDVIVNRIAKWNGTTWAPVGGGMNGSVHALTVYDDGSGSALYAGGDFTTAGGESASRIARWDGVAWSSLGTGTNDRVSALTVYDDGSGPALYAGGDFTTAGGFTTNRTAKWDGVSWSPLGGANASVDALTVYDDGSGPALYAGGDFTISGGVAANRIAKWDGKSWAPLGTGLNHRVYALAAYDDGSGSALYVGGRFNTAGGVNTSQIAKWDGTTWSRLGSGMNDWVLALTVYDDGSGPALYAGGKFTISGGGNANRIAKWDGAMWTTLGTGMDGWVWTLTGGDDGSGQSLYAAGDFAIAGGVGANRIARWDGVEWMASSVADGNGVADDVDAFTVYDDGSGPALYVGGSFSAAGGQSAGRIAKWDGKSWAPLGTGVHGVVEALTVFDDGSGTALYAAGGFTTAGGKTANHIAKWDGVTWTPLGTGMNHWVNALAVYDDGSGPALYAGGYFTTAGGITANRVAKWNGASWTPLGSGIGEDFDWVYALTVYDDGSGSALYVGGDFTTAGGGSASYIARWDGKTWTSPGTGMNSLVRALTVYDDGSGSALYAGGDFTTAGGGGANRIAKWDGDAWTSLGTGTTSWVSALTVYNDGSGPALYAGGGFIIAGGAVANRIARWDGDGWAPLGNGMSNLVYKLTVYDDGNGSALYVGGAVETAGDIASSFIAKWTCPAVPSSDLAITKTNGVSEVIAGATTTYTVAVTNPSPDDAPTVTVTDTFPSALTCSWTSTATGGASGNTDGSGPVLDDTLSMPAGSTVTYTAACEVDADATGQLTNTATIFAAGDPNLDNNIAIDTDTILQASDLEITLTNGTDDVAAGGTATYNLIVTNDGPSEVPASLADTFPAELTACRWQSIADAGVSGNTSSAGSAIIDTLTMPAGSEAHYVITCAVPTAATGTVTHTAIVTSPADPDPSNNTATDTDTLITPTTVKTLIVTNLQRLLTLANPGPGDLEALVTSLHEFAAHPNVQGLVLDVGHSADLADLYALWDAADGTTLVNKLANYILFGCHVPLPTGCAEEKDGIHDLLLQQILSHPEVEYLMLVGDDRILPMARFFDFTSHTREIEYTPLGSGGLTPGLTATNTTVGQAAADNRYLSDDPISLRSPVDVALLDEFLASFRPELATGRLVETPAEITYSLDLFLAQAGVVDLTKLDPDHRVLITGYDFLIDSSKQIRKRWKNVYGEPEPHDPADLIPVDGELISTDWDQRTAGDRADALSEHLTGFDLGHYSVMNFNGHATHYLEGVPTGSVIDIQGLSTAELDTLDLTGSVVYAVGCHGGLPVAGNAATEDDHPLDLPQTLLRRGALAYVANSGFGWGLIHGVGYSERMMTIFTEELSQGGTVTFGDAVITAKTRYYFEDMNFDSYDVKTSMQWTLFGFPMVSIHTGIAEPLAASDRDIIVERHVKSGGEPPPDYMAVEPRSLILTADGLFKKYAATDELVPPGTVGCPDPPAGEDPGCYYTLFNLATYDGDLPIEPILLEVSKIAGTSQHGILWLGGKYEQETGWVPLFAELVSNGGPVPLPGSLPPRLEWVHPRDGYRGAPSANQDPCRPTDTALNNVGIVPAELLFDDQLEPTIHRLHREIDIELLYYNNTDTADGNCDRFGPDFGDGPYHNASDTAVHWSVPASDDGGVWRVVVVYDDVVNQQWVPIDLIYDVPSDRWQGDLSVPGGATDLVYFLQAVDNRGNVSWAEFVPEEASPSGIERPLAMPFEVDFTLIFSDGFEAGDCSRWSVCP